MLAEDPYRKAEIRKQHTVDREAAEAAAASWLRRQHAMRKKACRGEIHETILPPKILPPPTSLTPKILPPYMREQACRGESFDNPPAYETPPYDNELPHEE